MRTAFVIDAHEFPEGTWRCDALLDGIVEAAMMTWGGRNNAIVLIDQDKDLSPGQWKLIEAFDPDRVQAFALLNKLWVERLDAKLMPWEITVDEHAAREEPKEEAPEAKWHWWNISLSGVSAPPSAETLRKYRRSKLLMVEFSPECPLEIRRFFHRNFGSFYQWFDHRGTHVRRIAWLEDILPSIETDAVRISDLDTACAVIHSFAGCLLPPTPRSALRFVAPTEISAFGLNEGFARHDYQSVFRLFVGDSLRDFTAYWNELRLCGGWGVPHRNALWVPASLAESAQFIEALSAYAYEYSGQHSSGSRHVEVTSESLSSAALETICSAFRSGKPRCGASAIESAKRQARLMESLRDNLAAPRAYARLDSSNAERLRLAERTETIGLKEPDALAGDGRWAVDVQVHFGASHRFNTPEWWCLPRRSGTMMADQIFRTHARVNRWHQFSVEVERQTGHLTQRRKPELHISLPDEARAVEYLLTACHYGFNSDDARKDVLNTLPLLDAVRVSDKGQNLRGLIEKFGSFWTAEDFCRRRFWREALAMLAGQDARRRINLADQIGNVVRSELRGDGKQDEMNAKAERITAKVLPWVHGALEDTPLSYAELKALLDEISTGQPSAQVAEYLSGDTIVHEHGIEPVTEEEMKRGLDQLLARNVLRAGFIVRCKHCGIESWFHVDEVSQFNECAGCGNPRPLTVGIEWRYRLNSLVKRCVSARVMAVLHAMTIIAQRSMACFLYSPNLELYRPGNQNAWRELDIACVSDGELVIGEVKDGSFDKRELERFADAAELIRPERAAVFIPFDRFDARVQQWLNELQSRLAPAGIRAELHQLPSI